MRSLWGTHPRAFVFTGRSRKIGRFGAACGKAPTCCAPISRRAPPRNSGPAISQRSCDCFAAMQLTEAEASFRALKSELSIRPLFHQLERRVQAHVMVAFLGYALWVTLKHLLKRRSAIVPQPSVSGVNNAHPLSAMKALALLSTLQSAD